MSTYKELAEHLEAYFKNAHRMDEVIAILCSLDAQQPYNAMVTDWQSVAAQPNEQDGPIADGWVLSVGDGYAGYGVYAHMTEYPEEGAVPVLEIDRAAQASKPLSDAWQEGYKAGVEDERISESNIDIAGYGAKVNPARQNPYGIKERG